MQRYFHAERLFDLDDLPGAADRETGRAHAEELSDLQAAFAGSAWASRTPIDVEVPFDMILDGPRATVIRGRIDAVFTEADGGAVVVDWK